MEIRLRKIIVLIGIVIFAFTLACSDDDDDDDNSSTNTEQTPGDNGNNPNGGAGEAGGPVVVPAAFDFSLIANATTTAPFVISQAGSNPERSVTVVNESGEPVTGTLDLGQAETSSGLVTFNQGDVVSVVARNFWGEDSRDLTITVLQPISFLSGVPASGEAVPTAGAFNVTYTLRTGTIDTVTVIFSPPTETTGVSVRLNEEAPVTMPPHTFEGLLNSTAPGWEQKADLSYIVLEKLAESIALSAQTVRAGEANQDALVSTLTAPGGIGHVAFTGDQFPSAEATGSRTLIWTDANGDGVVDGGDSFQWVFNDDWENRPGAVVNDITTGRMDLADFIMNTTKRHKETVLTNTGFQVTDGTRPAVLFTDFEQTEVEEHTPGVFTTPANRGFIINGGFDILFNG